MIIKQETQTFFHVKISDKVYSDLLNLLYQLPNTEHIIKEFLITEDNADEMPVSILNNMKNLRECMVKFQNQNQSEIPKFKSSEFEFSESENLSDTLDKNDMYNEECSVYLGKSNKGLNPVIIRVVDYDEEITIPLNHYNAIALVSELDEILKVDDRVVNRAYYYNNKGDKIDDSYASILLTKFPNKTISLTKEDKIVVLTEEEMEFIKDFISYHKNLK